jgi:predicted nucleic acid-binding protein
VSGRVEYLLDTNVLSETRKKKADAGVIAFLQGAESSALYISVLTLGELRKGVIAKRREDPIAARSLGAWVEGFELSFADRILDVDARTARLWGEWSGERPRPVVDTLLAATAVLHEFTLVTRNLRHVRGLPVKVLNPWTEPVRRPAS